MLDGLRRIRTELEVPGPFAPEVDDAVAAAIRAPRDAGERIDRRDLELVTIDPVGSRDLDQAVAAERRPGGTRVHYAIADVAAFVAPGDAVDRAAHERGVTFYLPDGRAPLYPDTLGEGAASLLPDQERPALLWTIDLDEAGAATEWRVERAIVRSRAAMTYAAAQRAIDGDGASESLVLLREIGLLREAQERARGGVSLPLPDQEVRERQDGYDLVYDAPRPVEGWNAQISLLTGICAALTMIDGGVGLLRTLPPADDGATDRLHRVATALDIDWPDDLSYPELVRRLDPALPTHAAFFEQAVSTLRGAGYAVVDASEADAPRHAALATPYAHVTAPLRRLADRFANEVIVALSAGVTPDPVVVGALEGLPDIMRETARRSSAVERAVVDLAEALVLRGREGTEFPAVVIDRDDDTASVLLRAPAVVAKVETGATAEADAALGREVGVRLDEVHPADRRVVFSLLG
ncbi:MAG: RNB domain-containing ribonuclease [Acidimicrobiia bacterium]